METPVITAELFHSVDLRVGRITAAENFKAAHNPSFLLQIDFGPEIGILKSSAQITRRYEASELVGKQVVAVVNLPPRQIGPIRSQCLILGAVPGSGDVSLLGVDHEIEPGTRIA